MSLSIETCEETRSITSSAGAFALPARVLPVGGAYAIRVQKDGTPSGATSVALTLSGQ